MKIAFEGQYGEPDQPITTALKCPLCSAPVIAETSNHRPIQEDPDDPSPYLYLAEDCEDSQEVAAGGELFRCTQTAKHAFFLLGVKVN